MKKKKALIPIIVLTVLIIIFVIALNPSVRYNRISVSENKWNSIMEGRTQSDGLVLDDIEFNDYNLIIDRSGSTLYYSVVNDSNNKFNPSVGYKSNYKNTKLAILSDEITDEKVKSDYKFKVMLYSESEYHIYDLVCTDLPILNIRYKADFQSKYKSVPMEIYLFNNLSNTPSKVTVSNGKLKVNDNNYLFSLNKTTPGKNIRDNKISILNMKPNSEYVLTEATNNEKETTQESNNVEPKNHRIELFINNQHKGTYEMGYVEK